MIKNEPSMTKLVKPLNQGRFAREQINTAATSAIFSMAKTSSPKYSAAEGVQ